MPKRRPNKVVRRELRMTKQEASDQDAAAVRAKRTWSDWIRVVAAQAADEGLR